MKSLEILILQKILSQIGGLYCLCPDRQKIGKNELTAAALYYKPYPKPTDILSKAMQKVVTRAKDLGLTYWHPLGQVLEPKNKYYHELAKYYETKVSCGTLYSGKVSRVIHWLNCNQIQLDYYKQATQVEIKNALGRKKISNLISELKRITVHFLTKDVLTEKLSTY